MPNSLQTPFSQVVSILPARLQQLLYALPQRLQETLREIRLRQSKPLVLVFPQHTGFLTAFGTVSALCSETLPTVREQEIGEIVARACGYSAHSHQEELRNGFLTLPGGHRIGVCGTAVYRGGALSGLRDPTALNIRIARHIPTAADRVLRACFQDGLRSVLLAGPPMSGKTTVLRAMAVRIAQGYCARLATCAVIDVRDELFPPGLSAPLTEQFFGDILRGYEKAAGIRQAVRTLSPEMVFCDEIGSKADVDAIADGCRCGVRFAASVHAGSSKELKERAGIRELLDTGCFSYVVFLGTGEQVGKPLLVLQTGEKNAQERGAGDNFCGLRMDGDASFRSGARTSA